MDTKTSDKSEKLAQLALQVSACERCGLHKERVKAVPGEGDPDSPLLFIGEGPGFHEDQQGRPFVGAAGSFLESLLDSIGLTREQVFITNVVKCRPPGNRDPLPEEIAACVPYLRRQFAIIAPKIVVTLGRYSMGLFFKDAKISRVHGKPKKVDDIIVIPMYHPAAGLHRHELKVQIEADFQVIRSVLDSLSKAQEDDPSASQMQLFK